MNALELQSSVIECEDSIGIGPNESRCIVIKLLPLFGILLESFMTIFNTSTSVDSNSLLYTQFSKSSTPRRVCQIKRDIELTANSNQLSRLVVGVTERWPLN